METNDNRNWQPLNPNLVEKGTVYILPLFSIDGVTVSLLRLMPNSKIAEHMHTDDEEYYFDFEDGSIFFCAKGDSHSYANDSDTIKELLSIKTLKRA